MSTQKKNPIERKAKLMAQLDDIKKEIAEFDNKRSAKIGALAKKYKLINLSDDVLESEFKALHEKHKSALESNAEIQDRSKKNS